MGTKKTFVLMSLTMIVATCTGGKEPTQARGFDEGPWMMDQQQPEILIVKEKGGSAPAASSSSSKMKDLTPIICLLAPLLLAAILLPAKMTMSMNGMMSNNMQNGMLPNGFMMMPNGMVPLTALMTSGVGNANLMGLPLYKDSILSKKFSNDNEQQERVNETFSENNSSNKYMRNTLKHNEKNKETAWFATNLSGYKTTIKRPIVKTNEKIKGFKTKGDAENDEWVSRVWSTETTIADEILKIFDDIQKSYI